MAKKNTKNQTMLSTSDLASLLKNKFKPTNNPSGSRFLGEQFFLSKELTPKIFAYSGQGIALQTNIKNYQGEVLDFCGQTVTCILGQNDPWVNANVIAFMLSTRPNFLSLSIGQEVFYTFPKRVQKFLQMGKNSFINHRLNNGSDAVDLSINIAYNYFKGNKKTLLAFKGSYHGQGHLPYGVSDLQSHLRFSDKISSIFLEAPSHVTEIKGSNKLSEHDLKIIKDLRKYSPKAFAVLIEPIQFNNNGNTPSVAFMKALRQECDRLKLPLIFDEVQTAWGWLGKLTAAEKYGVWPDIMALSKSITAGYGPLAMVVAQDKFRNVGTVGSRTNGANTRSLIAAHAVLDRLIGTKDIPAAIKKSVLGQELSQGLLSQFESKSKLLITEIENLRNEINKHKNNLKIGEIKGSGLARMIEIKDKRGNFNSSLTNKVQNELLFKAGVFVRVPNNKKDAYTLFIKMPLVATENQIKLGFARMKKVMLNI